MTDSYVLRPLARADIRAAVEYYAAEASNAVALRFEVELRAALDLIAKNPGVGSRRFARDADRPELRSFLLRTFPFLIFYVEEPHRVRVLRVLHGRRDIPSLITEFDA